MGTEIKSGSSIVGNTEVLIATLVTWWPIVDVYVFGNSDAHAFGTQWNVYAEGPGGTESLIASGVFSQDPGTSQIVLRNVPGAGTSMKLKAVTSGLPTTAAMTGIIVGSDNNGPAVEGVSGAHPVGALTTFATLTAWHPFNDVLVDATGQPGALGSIWELCASFPSTAGFPDCCVAAGLLTSLKQAVIRDADGGAEVFLVRAKSSGPTTGNVTAAIIGHNGAAGGGGGGGGSSPGGANTDVQFNDGGAFGGTAGLTFDKVAGKLVATLIGAYGADTQVQFNDGGNIAGNAGLVFTKAAGKLTATQIAAYGADTQVQINDGGLIAGASDLKWNKTARALSAGTGTTATSATAAVVAAIGNGAVATTSGNNGAIALLGAVAHPCTANGDGVLCAGIDSSATIAYSSVLSGNLSSAVAAGAIALGEFCAVGASGANSVCIGYNSSCAHVYSTALGVGHTAIGNYTQDYGLRAASSLNNPGEHAASAGQPNSQRALNEIYAHLNAATGNLANVDGGTFVVPNASLQAYICIAMGQTAGAAKKAYEVRLLLVQNTTGTPSIVDNILLSTAGVNFAAAGWTLTISGQASNELRFAVNPGADNGRFQAHLYCYQSGNNASP